MVTTADSRAPARDATVRDKSGKQAQGNDQDEQHYTLNSSVSRNASAIGQGESAERAEAHEIPQQNDNQDAKG
jgi:hypothetical protein